MNISSNDVLEMLDGNISDVDLASAKLNYSKQKDRGIPSDMTCMSYYQALITSSKENVKKGIQFLEEYLLNANEYIKESIVLRLAIAHARIKEYDRALSYLKLLEKLGKNKETIIFLEKTVKRRMQKEAIVGAAFIGGIVMVGTILIAALFTKRK